MAHKKLGEFATPNDDYLCAPITQPVVEAEKIGRASCRERVCQYV